MTFEPGWLERQLEAATQAVAEWPAWKRAARGLPDPAPIPQHGIALQPHVETWDEYLEKNFVNDPEGKLIRK